MGIALWMLSGLTAFAAGRFVTAGRPAGFAGELMTALLTAFIAGLLATALDFGGWGELDWRAGSFVFLCALAAIGATRATRLTRSAVRR